MHDYALPWLHHQGNNFLLKASSKVYKILGLQTAAIHIVHVILSHELVDISVLHIHTLAER